MEVVQPFGTRVLVKRLEAKKISDGGIFIPSDAREKPMYGIVKALSDFVGAEIGEVVLFGKYSGVEVSVGNEILVLLRAEELFGKIVDNVFAQKLIEEGV